MNRMLAAMAMSAMLASSIPTVGFADESSSASSEAASSESESSASESSSSSEASSASSAQRDAQRPCDDLTGLRKAQCLRKQNASRTAKKDRVQRRTEDRALRIISKCRVKTGAQKVACMKRIGKGIKKEVRRAIKTEVKRTVRGKRIEASTSSASN